MNDTASAMKLKALLTEELEKRFPDNLDVSRFELENEWRHHFEHGDQELADALLEDEALLSKFTDAFLENINHLSTASSITLELEQMLMGICTEMSEA
ncbi:MAG TPA: hypothetical protein QF517_06810 [Pseudomonadales bacterium]|jgi:hypothetical protein|nr:hypothetical protein [Gammaproteobacteria bacterium]MDP6026190.1 hypothetical protein [Pseudomonadales bacterium]MDP6314945.1 hypothetical protein [Pseudomonadales bacterium]MDP7314823.1 hypothetical protein [Pseudomonadales bacterium]MDP7575974.1 hypothetical protein [Pseudomonadales bacterium]|tara:strand:- start:136 stop:429 length:294 start_codon:yes stop_codon:yes gene_type:complete